MLKTKLQFCSLLAVGLSAAVSVTAQSRPRMPFVDKGACPFECCSYRQWTVDKPTLVRSAMRDSAPAAFRLRRGEKVRGLTGVVITTEAGIAEVLKPIDEAGPKLSPGDRIYLLTNEGEGYVKAWFKGKIIGAEPYDPSNYKLIREPKSVWWVKVRNRAGKIGWSREPENFGNKDECGG